MGAVSGAESSFRRPGADSGTVSLAQLGLDRRWVEEARRHT